MTTFTKRAEVIPYEYIVIAVVAVTDIRIIDVRIIVCEAAAALALIPPVLAPDTGKTLRRVVGIDIRHRRRQTLLRRLRSRLFGPLDRVPAATARRGEQPCGRRTYNNKVY